MAAVDLGDFVDVLKREVNPPGRTVFAQATEDDWIGYLSDAFWEARLDGFLLGWTCDDDAVIVAEPTDAEATFPRQLTALVIIYAGLRVLRNQIMNTNTTFRAKAGATEFERQNSATMLAEMLKQLTATKGRLTDQLEEAAAATSVYGFDAIAIRVFEGVASRGLYELT